MPDLVTLSEFKTYLGITESTDDVLLTALLEHVESMLESETGRTLIPFRAAQTGRVEVIDGSAARALYVDYPIATLTSVLLGLNPTSPDETLTVGDPYSLVYATGSRRIERTDGGTFGRWTCPRFVRVTYDTQDDLPENAKLAIKSVAAMAYRRRGSEEMKSETLGDFYSYTKADAETATASDPFWHAAVAANRRPLLV